MYFLPIPDWQAKKTALWSAAKSREETPKEGIYSQRLYDNGSGALHKCQATFLVD
ncbi:hypothetical protein J2046_005275 [Rhizobium petrolearium]|nr:hypothetical protein [Neorhizobium petrolearium]